MSLDATEVHLTKVGTLEMGADGSIYLKGWDGHDCTCRDVATLALVHVIGVLQQELMWEIMKPGGSGNVGMD